MITKHENIASPETDEARLARTGLSSVRLGDEQAAAVQKTPFRISLDSIEDAVEHKQFINPESMPHMTICVVILRNGFSLVGKSAPADPENFNPDLGAKFAYEDAIRQAWPLFAFALREHMGTPALNKENFS